MGQSTWAAKTTTWDTDTNIWANTTYADSVILNSNSDFTLGYNTKYPVTANMTQINLSELNEEDAKKIASALMALSAGTTASCTVSIPLSAILSNELLIRNNTNFEESASMSMTNTTSSGNNFLWNDITEDSSTTWTKVADADE